MILQVQNRVVKALQEEKIDFILYGSTVITDRETNDVDIIVKKEDFDNRVDEVFKKLGYHRPIPFVFEKKYQNGSRYNVEVKYDLHPKLTKTLEELWDYTYIDKDGVRKFKPLFHALVLALHTDRHIKEGLFDHVRITDLNKIKVNWNKVIELAKKINNTGLAEDPVKRIYNLLHNPNESGYSREELLYPPEKRLFEDEMTKKLLNGEELKDYLNIIRHADIVVRWEAGYGDGIIVNKAFEKKLKFL